MGLRVNTNVASMNAQRALAGMTERLNASYRRLSTGLRIATASDDAAGLSISERFRTQIRSTHQALRNAQDGISLTQTGEGALNEVSAILIRLRELSVQAANSTAGASDRDTLHQEFSDLVQEIDRIARATTFNGVNLLDGTGSSVAFQVGIGNLTGVDTILLALGGVLATTLGLGTIDIGSQGRPSVAISAVDAAIQRVSSLRGSFGAAQNRLTATIDNLRIAAESLSASESRIRDADLAQETADLTRNQVVQQAAIAMLAQANVQPEAALQLLRA